EMHETHRAAPQPGNAFHSDNCGILYFLMPANENLKRSSRLRMLQTSGLHDEIDFGRMHSIARNALRMRSIAAPQAIMHVS
ncbi:MAG: hypothetical protein IJ268_09840, partial [Proteobacteria bacterium]|nr:hypothetical protein [Pseudomonadota bacterium]